MDSIEEVSVGPLTVTSLFLKPLRMHYTQNKVKKNWDLVRIHDSVSIILFNKDKQKMVLVKQFRPAVYYNDMLDKHQGTSEEEIGTFQHPSSTGITLELCAGIVDKNLSLEEVARQEVLEECGYDVPLERFEHVKTFRSGVGISGDRQTMFYAEVSNKMKLTEGGGNPEEGELIKVVEMSIEEVEELLAKPDVQSPVGLLFGLTWFMLHKNKSKNKNSSSST